MSIVRLSGVDTAFLAMETPRSPMHLGAVAVFEASYPSAAEHALTLLRARAREVSGLRRQVSSTWLPPGGAVWTGAADLDVCHHIRAHAVPFASTDDLAGVVSRVMAEPLDLSRPPWQLHVIGAPDDQGFAIVAKFHHALCDGYGAIDLGRGLLDAPERPRSRAPAAPPEPVPPAPDQFAAGVRAASGLAMQALTAVSIASSIVGAVRVPPASPLLTGTPGNRRVVLSRLPAGEVRQIRRRHGGTTHDVMLAVLAGALRDFLSTRGHGVDRMRPVRALIPTNQRRPGNAYAAGNHLSGYLCELPVDVAEPLLRLRRVRTAMDAHKAAGPTRGPGALPVLAGALPPAVHRLASPVLAGAAPWLFDTVITTVSLPVQASLGGAPMRALYPLAPLARGHALAVALCCDRDSIHIGLHVDDGALPDIEKLAGTIPTAVAELLHTPGRSVTGWNESPRRQSGRG